jgi:hypothetical protein
MCARLEYVIWRSWLISTNTSIQVNNPIILSAILLVILITSVLLMFARKSFTPTIRALTGILCTLCIINALFFGYVRTAAGGFVDYSTGRIVARYRLEKSLLVGASIPADVSFVYDNDGSVDTLPDITAFGHDKIAAVQGKGKPGTIYSGKNVLIVYRENVLITLSPVIVYELEGTYNTDVHPDDQGLAARQFPIVAKLAP